MSSTSRYIVEKKPDQIQTALRGIIVLAKDLKISDVTLVVPKKGGWENSTVAEVLGKDVAKALLSGQRVALTTGVFMSLEGSQTFRASFGQQLLVGLHLSSKDMAKLDDAVGPTAIVFVPWSESEAQEWKQTWQPQTIGPIGAPVATTGLSQPVIDALTSLTELINLGTGLNHPSDKQHAKNTIAKLRQAGHAFDPVHVRDWALRHGWSSGAAAELEKLARK